MANQFQCLQRCLRLRQGLARIGQILQSLRLRIEETCDLRKSALHQANVRCRYVGGFPGLAGCPGVLSFNRSFQHWDEPQAGQCLVQLWQFREVSAG
eukprot:11433305-Alexandrium_andersonii.AAC.1